MKKMRRHQERNHLQIFVCLTLLVHLSNSSFLLQTATDSSLADRESRIIRDSSFGLKRRDRKLEGSNNDNGDSKSTSQIKQNTKQISSNDQSNLASKDDIAEVMNTVKEKLFNELRNSKKENLNHDCEVLSNKGKKLESKNRTNYDQYYLMDSDEIACVFGSFSCSFDSASESYTVTADLFDQGGENNKMRKNYNLMISIQVADKSNSGSSSEPFYEDKHLLAVNLLRETFRSQLEAELGDILQAFASEKKINKSSIDDIYCKLHQKILPIISQTDSISKCEPTSEQNSDTNLKTEHILVKDVIFDRLELSLSDTNGSSATFKAQIGSLAFTMIVPRRGWDESGGEANNDSNGAQILTTFDEEFTKWWEKVKNFYPKDTNIKTEVSHDKLVKSKFLEHIKKYIMSGLEIDKNNNKTNCFKGISEGNEFNPKASSYTVLSATPTEENPLSQTFVIHLITDPTNTGDENGPCAHTKSTHKSPDYITIYFHHFTSGSLNYGHLAIDSETQYVESLVDLSKGIESSIKSQIKDFLKSDEYKNVEKMTGHTFSQTDVCKLLARQTFPTNLKCIATILPMPNTCKLIASEDEGQILSKDVRTSGSIFACANDDKNSGGFDVDNMVLNVRKIDDRLVDIRLTWPKNFDHNNLKDSEATKSGLDMQFDFPEYNAYDQIKDKIGQGILKFLKLIQGVKNKKEKNNSQMEEELYSSQRNLELTNDQGLVQKSITVSEEQNSELQKNNTQIEGELNPNKQEKGPIEAERKLVNYDRHLTNSSTQIIGSKKLSIENKLSQEKLFQIATEQSRVFDFEPIYNHPLSVRRYVKKTLNSANQSWFDLQRFSTNNIHENSSSESLVTEKLAINKIAPRI